MNHSRATFFDHCCTFSCAPNAFKLTLTLSIVLLSLCMIMQTTVFISHRRCHRLAYLSGFGIGRRLPMAGILTFEDFNMSKCVNLNFETFKIISLNIKGILATTVVQYKTEFNS